MTPVTGGADDGYKYTWWLGIVNPETGPEAALTHAQEPTWGSHGIEDSHGAGKCECECVDKFNESQAGL